MNQNSSDMYLSTIYSILRACFFGVFYFLVITLLLVGSICLRAYEAGYTITISNLFIYLVNVDLVLFLQKMGIFIFVTLAFAKLSFEEKIAVPSTFPYSSAINVLLGIAFFGGYIWLGILFTDEIPQLYLFGR